jgi:Ca2+-binding RTX toxin-like protein
VVFEGDETFNVNLTGVTNASIDAGSSAATVTIIDNEVEPSVSIAGFTIAEGDAVDAPVATLTLQLTGASQTAVTVQFDTNDVDTVAGGTLTLGEDDYNAIAGGIATFDAGATTTTINVTLNGDEVFEGDETFTVDLSNPVGAALGGDSVATVTIIDDEALPGVSIAGLSITESDAVDDPIATLTLQLTGASQTVVEVNFNTTDVTAEAGGVLTLGADDYDAIAGGLVTFAPGSTTATIDVTLNGDEVFEGDETFTVDLLTPSGATLVPDSSSATVTIGDDEIEPEIDITGFTIAEGNAVGAPIATLTLQMSSASQSVVSVNFDTANGTAVADGVLANGADDYNAITGGLATFAPGSTTATIDVTLNGDGVFEGNETFNVNLSTPSGASLANSSATVTIIDDETSPNIAILGTTVDEGDAGPTIATFTVGLDTPSGTPVTVNFESFDGSAAQAPGFGGNDYESVAGTLTFAPGQTLQTIEVTVNGDTNFEADENFTVDLSGENGAILVVGTATGGITNDDDPPTAIVGDTSVLEGDAGTSDLVFEVSLTGVNTSAPVTVTYQVTPGTAAVGIDYVDPGVGTVFFPFGSTETTQLVTVQVNGDVAFEDDETLSLELTGITAGGQLGADTVGVGTIVNDDDPATYDFAQATYAAVEGNTPDTTNVVVQVDRSGDTTVETTVDVQLASGDPAATVGTDFTAGPISVTFAPTEVSQLVTVEVIGDDVFEQDEVISLSFGNFGPGVNGQSGATRPTAEITIQDDDPQPPTYNFNRATYQINEGNATRTVNLVQVLRTGDDLSVTSTADVVFSNGPAPAAVAGVDYTGGTFTVTFDPGETSAIVPIEVLGDETVEPDENFTLSLENFSGDGIAGFDNTVATVTLRNDDNVPIFEFQRANYRVLESDINRTVDLVQVVRSGLTNAAASVDVRLVGQTATAGQDFTGGLISLNFAANETIQTVPIEILGDDLVETDETVRLSFTNFTNGGISGAVNLSTLTIADDDETVEPPPTEVPVYNFGSFRYEIAEGNARRRVRIVEVQRSGNTDIASSVVVRGESFGINGATPGSDFYPGPYRVRFAAGETVQRVPLAIFGDRRVERDERARLTFTSFTNDGEAGLRNRTIVILTNDDGQLPDRNFPPRTPGCVEGERIVGNAQNNVLRGARDNDTILGRAGNDRLAGFRCDDTLLGGFGNDILFGGSQNDILRGQAGNDRLLGGTGIDLLDGGIGRDTLLGQAGNDRLLGGAGDDRIEGGLGNDLIIGGGGSDTLIGGAGRDIFFYNSLVQGIDAIEDFQPGIDRINLRRLGISRSDISIEPSIGLGFSGSTVVSVRGRELIVLEGIETDDLSLRRDFLV